MKNKFIFIITALLTVVSCGDYGEVGVRPGRPGPSGGNVDFVERKDWQIEYTGRGLVAFDGKNHLEDTFDASCPNTVFYFDVISAEDFRKTYRNSITDFIINSYNVLENDNVATSSNKDSYYFDVLDEGGRDWIAVAYSVGTKGPSGGYKTLNFKTKALQARETSAWTMEYKRVEDLKKVVTDYVTVSTSERTDYMVYCTWDEQLKYDFGNDLMSFFRFVKEQTGVHNGSKTVSLGRLKCDYWDIYLIECDVDGNPTGFYSKKSIDIPVETPEAEYTRWLGTWSVFGSGNKAPSYTINISVNDPNYDYVMTGWEGQNEDAMSVLLEYGRLNHNLLFNASVVGGGSDRDGDYEIDFVGDFVYDNQEQYTFNLPGIASATFRGAGNTADLLAQDVAVPVDGGSPFITKMKSMSYRLFYYETERSVMLSRPELLPKFPMVLDKISAPVSTSVTKAARSVGTISKRHRTGLNPDRPAIVRR